MQKTLFYLMLLAIVGKSYAQIPQDKVLHFVGGNLYGLVGAGVANQISKGDRAWTFVGSVGGSLLIGLAKESIDESQYGGWDNSDILATVLGGITVGATIDIFKQRKKRKREQAFKEAIGLQLLPRHELPTGYNEIVSLNLLAISSGVLNRVH